MKTITLCFSILIASFLQAGCSGLQQSELQTLGGRTRELSANRSAPILLEKSPSGLVTVWIEQTANAQDCYGLSKSKPLSISALALADSLVK